MWLRDKLSKPLRKRKQKDTLKTSSEDNKPSGTPSQPPSDTPTNPTDSIEPTKSTEFIEPTAFTRSIEPTSPYGLKHLNPNESSDTSKNRVEVDIVAIHGLNGNAFTTWTHSNNTLWLRDLLPTSLPGARIFTYGYPSKALFSDSVATLRDYSSHLLSDLNAIPDGAGRPIIFVCHSLGGIVCKQALVLAHEDDRLYGNILSATAAIVFFGTPHRGSKQADIAKTVGKVVDMCLQVSQISGLTGSNRNDLFLTLGSGSQTLNDLATSSRNRLRTLEIVSFHETQKMYPLSELIVDKQSAIMDVPNEQITPLYANHRTMCQFGSENENGYRIVVSALQRLAKIALVNKEMLAKSNRTSSNPSLSEAEKSCMILLNSTFLAEFKAQLPRPVQGTCSWILSHPEYLSWINTNDTRLLWVTGEPGCGKTMLSAYLTEHLRLNRTTPAKPQVFFFFCDDKLKSQRDGNAILRGILFQILQQHRRLIKHVKSRFDTEGHSLANSFPSLWELFRKIVADSKLGPIGVIVDAVDECEARTRKMFLEAIMQLIRDPKELHQPPSNCIKFLITSRPSLGNTYHLPGQLKYRLRIDQNQGKVSEDVKLVIRSKVGEIAARVQCDDETKNFLEQTLYSKSDQTFLWLTMVLHGLENSPRASKKDFERIINSIPRDLEATYSNALLKIPSEYQTDAKKILSLLIGSSRRLTLTEMNIAFTIDEHHRSTSAVIDDLQLSMSSTLQNIVGFFVRLKDADNGSLEETKVSLIHQSAKEYLTDIATCSQDPIVQSLATPPEDAALSISWACVQYLLLQDFREDLFAAKGTSLETTSPTSPISPTSPTSPPLDPDDTASWDGPLGLEDHLGLESFFKDTQILDEERCFTIVEQYKFFEYAATHWAEHFSSCERVAPPTLQDAIRHLVANPGHCRMNWLKYYWIRRNIEYPFPDSFDPVEIAAFFNFPILLEELLQSYVEEDQTTKERALFWAARMCCSESISVLLQYVDNPNSIAIDRQTALTVSAQYGHFDVVKVLLGEPRIEAKLRGKSGRSALSFAAGNGHLEIVEELLKHGAYQPDDHDNQRWTPIFWAVQGDHGNVLHTLFKSAAVDINQVDKGGRSALSWAAGEGLPGVLRFLLRQPQLDLNLKDSKGRSPLSWAAGSGQTEIVRKLMRTRGVDKSSKDHDGRSAISWACQGGHRDVVLNLLKYGCGGVDDVDVDGWTPLAWALFLKSPDTVDALLSSRLVQIDRQDKGGLSALIWAADYGYPEVIELLVSHGASLTITNANGHTAEEVAKINGYMEISEFLKSQKQKQGETQSVLHVASPELDPDAVTFGPA